MPITRISHAGKSWPIEKFVQACLDGDCDFPAPVAATIIENMKDYSNHGTISGSQLHNECDYSRLLERLPYTQSIENMFYATYRGSNVHATIEKCQEKPEFKDWVFEKRFFAILRPDDSMEKLLVPERSSVVENGHTVHSSFPDWDAFKVICDEERAKGNIIVSGQVDTYDGKNQTLEDWKGQPLTAPILTPKGWTTMGDLRIGEEVIGSHGTTKVTGIYPLGKRTIYRVKFLDGGYVDCTDDHLWAVVNTRGQRKILTTMELVTQVGMGGYHFIELHKKPILFQSTEPLPLDPYVLGLLLGDGGLSSSVLFTTLDEELAAAIRDATGWKMVKTKSKDRTPTYSFSGARRIVAGVGMLGHLSHEKFIQRRYLQASPEQRLALLQGLLDTDGWAQKGIAKFSTTSSRLAQGVKELTFSLGGLAFHCTRKKKRNPTEKVEHIVTVRLPNGMAPFRLNRKLDKLYRGISGRKTDKDVRSIKSIEVLGTAEAQCIKVDAADSLYTTSDFVLTHNTAKMVGPWTDVKESWQQQMNCYTVVLELNGLRIKRIRITVMDATQPVCLDVPVVNKAVWIPAYFIPRARYLSSLQQYSDQDIQDINDGLVDPPQGFPEPVKNYLCDGENRDKKIYCPFRENGMCPVWRAEFEAKQKGLTEQLEASVKKVQ